MRTTVPAVRRVLAGCGFVALAALGVGLATGNILLADAGTVAVLALLSAWLISSGVLHVLLLIEDRRAREEGGRGAGWLRRTLARGWLLAVVLLVVICLRLTFYVIESP